MEWQLAEEPPVDRLVAIYFAAQKWWEPPARASAARDDAAEDESEVWECPLPDVTE